MNDNDVLPALTTGIDRVLADAGLRAAPRLPTGHPAGVGYTIEQMPKCGPARVAVRWHHHGPGPNAPTLTCAAVRSPPPATGSRPFMPPLATISLSCPCQAAEPVRPLTERNHPNDRHYHEPGHRTRCPVTGLRVRQPAVRLPG